MAREVREQLREIRLQLIETAKHTQAREAVVEKSEKRLAALKAHHAARAGDLSKLRNRLFGITAALQRLARRPPEAVLTSPRPPLETARAMLLIRHLVPTVKARTDRVRVELTKLETLNHQIETEQGRFQAANEALEARRDQLDLLIERKNAMWVAANQGAASSSSERDQLVQSAASLGALFAALQKLGGDQAAAAKRLTALIKAGPKVEPPKDTASPSTGGSPPKNGDTARPSAQTSIAPRPSTAPLTRRSVPTVGSFRARKGRLTFPAIGRLIRRYGETDDVGLTTKGVTLQTRANAPVVAAHDGKVIYAGPFRGYGRIIIIEHGQGFLTLLAGLGRIDVQSGQGLLAGEPVGTMRGADTIGDADSRQLYIELRKDGAPVDPLAWLSTQRNTANQ
jgi:murein hydrolase activator